MRGGADRLSLGSKPEHDPQSGRGLRRATGLTWGGNIANARAADDFQAIRARMVELRRERERVDDAEPDARSVRLSLCRANGDAIIVSVGRLRKELADWHKADGGCLS